MEANKSKENKPESREEIWDKAFMAMCKGLDAYGPREILNILVENARHDQIVFQLLLRFPTVVSSAEFFHSLKVIKTNKQTFHRLKRRGWIL